MFDAPIATKSLASAAKFARKHDGEPPAQLRERNRVNRSELCLRLIDSAIRGRAHDHQMQCTDESTEWTLVDTRESDPGFYRIRRWTDAYGQSRPVEPALTPRHGGAIGLFTLHDQCASVGPCPPQVDEGAGLLLIGFTNLTALPLPARGARVFQANWLVILSANGDVLTDAEIDHLLSQLWSIFDSVALLDELEQTTAQHDHFELNDLLCA
jgi:hypothetical protein